MPSIVEAIGANPIKNGTLLVKVAKVPPITQTIDTYVSNDPDITTIGSKYDTRFDDPRYYSGDTTS